MKPNQLPSQNTLLTIFKYEDGVLFHLLRPDWIFRSGLKQSAKHNAAIWNGRYAGHRADKTVTTNGYCRTSINGVSFGVHRIIFKMHHGYDPIDVDHINGNRSDNRIENLRSVTRSVNMRNLSIRSDSSSRSVGVSWEKLRGKWNAYINVNGKRKNLGYFPSKEIAIEARAKAQKGLGFTSRHGTST
jgi:HNH endonuclease